MFTRRSTRSGPRRVAVMTMAVAVAASGLTGWGVAGAQAAMAVPAAKAYKACVKKKTGEMRILLTKKAKKQKCAKGWRKISWSGNPPTGAPGAPGAGGAPGDRGVLGALEAYDSTGARIGSLVGGLSFMSAYPFYEIMTDNGQYIYTGSGFVIPNLTPYYLNNTCTGTAHYRASDSELSEVLALVGTTARMVARSSDTTLGPISAFSVTNRWAPVVAASAWRVSSAGVCTDATPLTTNLVELNPVTPAPTDRPGPISLL